MKRLGPLRRALVDLHTGALKVVILYNRQEDGLSHETSLPLRLVIAPRQTHNPPIGFPWPPPHLLPHSLQPKPRQPQPTAVSNPYFSVTSELLLIWVELLSRVIPEFIHLPPRQRSRPPREWWPVFHKMLRLTLRIPYYYQVLVLPSYIWVISSFILACLSTFYFAVAFNIEIHGSLSSHTEEPATPYPRKPAPPRRLLRCVDFHARLSQSSPSNIGTSQHSHNASLQPRVSQHATFIMAVSCSSKQWAKP